MQCIIDQASIFSKEIIEKRKQDFLNDQQNSKFNLSWKCDSSQYDTILFKGYAALYKTSEITGQRRLYYDHDKPFEKKVKLYSYFSGHDAVDAPKAYIIPQGWFETIDRLKNNGVQMRQLIYDSIVNVGIYHIDQFHSFPSPYEKHHRNTDVVVSKSIDQTRFLKGDYIIYTNQPAKRFIIEMLEPTGDDSYFSWNFMDAILQEKESYSDYRWEDVAADYLKSHPDLKTKLEERKKADTSFANNASAQLNFIYKNSPYYEKEHLRYPIYRIEH